MVNEIGSSDPTDPFHNYSTFSLFPRTFRVSTDHLQNSNDRNSIETVHSCLKSMVLRSPKKLLEQAKVIVDGGSNLMNSNLTNHVPSEENNNEEAADAAKGEENLRRRRPGLGFKRDRARFDFKPSLSQTTVSSEPTLDMDKVALEIEKLQDPEEYFLAHKRLEIAKKEIQRQMGGVSTDSNKRDPPAAAQPRQRRPGIFGSRRTGRFKDFYSQMRSENDETFLSSQDIFVQDIPSPSSYSAPQENNVPNIALFERECAGTVSTTENKVKELFNELLSKNPEDLEGNRAITLLQERLQIKPIVIDKLCLPNLHDIPKIDFKVSGGNLLKPRNSFSNIRAKLKGISSHTPAKQRREAESSVGPIASPTPPKSPFAAISLLNRRISQSNPSHDPFSALDVDQLPAKNPSPVGSIDKQSDQVEMEKDLSISENVKSLLHEDDSTVSNMGSCEVVADDLTRPVDKYVNEYSKALGVGDVHSKGLHGEFEANTGGNNGDVMIIDDKSISCGTPSNASANTPNNFEDSAGDMLQEAVASVEPDINNEDILCMPDQPSSASVEEIAMDGRCEIPDVGPKQHIEKIQEFSRTSFDQSPRKSHPRQKLNVPSKATKLKEPKRKENSRRQSLAAAGTKWESGVRRSTRIKMRPLEYWKGERFLYGRIHQSLATVIGVKYVSPTKGDEEPTLTVKSYVSDHYKELVDLAALH